MVLTASLEENHLTVSCLHLPVVLLHPNLHIQRLWRVPVGGQISPNGPHVGCQVPVVLGKVLQFWLGQVELDLLRTHGPKLPTHLTHLLHPGVEVGQKAALVSINAGMSGIEILTSWSQKIYIWFHFHFI